MTIRFDGCQYGAGSRVPYFRAGRFVRLLSLAVAAGGMLSRLVHANPNGGVIVQGSGTIPTTSPNMTIPITSANAFITWQSFDIAAGETTTFVQPSASSVVWNQISGPQSQIMGNLNANGYVILQNPNGFQ